MKSLPIKSTEAAQRKSVLKVGHLRIFSNSYVCFLISQIMFMIFLFSFWFEQPYIELATSYSTGKIAELEAYVQTHREQFESVSSLSCIIHSALSSILVRSLRLDQIMLDKNLHLDFMVTWWILAWMIGYLKVALIFFSRTTILDWWSRLYHPSISEISKDWLRRTWPSPSKTLPIQYNWMVPRRQNCMSCKW